MYSLKLLTKPIIQFIKNQEKKNPHKNKTLSKPFFVFIGNCQYRLDLWINKKVLGIKTDDEIFVKKLNDDIALSEGVQFFWELMTYLILLIVTAHEYNKYSRESEESKQKLETRLSLIEKNHIELKGKFEEVLDQQSQIRQEILCLRDELKIRNMVLKEIDKFQKKNNDQQYNYILFHINFANSLFKILS